jgi:hypothetical protein
MNPDYLSWCIITIALTAPSATVALKIASDFAWHARYLARTWGNWSAEDRMFASLLGGDDVYVGMQSTSAWRCRRFAYTCIGLAVTALIPLLMVPSMDESQTAPSKSKSVVPRTPSSQTKW